jgi:hypothetical protein
MRACSQRSKPAATGRQQKATDIALTPAACYPLYPTVAKRGALPAAGPLFDLTPIASATNRRRIRRAMQMFRMREFVRMGTPEQVTAFRQLWIERGAGDDATSGCRRGSMSPTIRSSAAPAAC